MLSLGFGAEFGSAASYLLHALNLRGGTGSFRVEGGNENLPRAFAAKIADLLYGAPVASVTQDDRSVTVRLRSGETLTGDGAICALPCPVIGRMFEGARFSEAEGARDSGAALFEGGESVLAGEVAVLAEGEMERVRDHGPGDRAVDAGPRRRAAGARGPGGIPDGGVRGGVGGDVRVGARGGGAGADAGDFPGDGPGVRRRHVEGLGGTRVSAGRLRCTRRDMVAEIGA